MAKFEGIEWTFPLLDQFWKEIEIIGKEFGITYPPMQIEMLSADQMVDTIAMVGAPCHFDHWSLGKESIKLQEEYRKGQAGIALELVINSNPSIMYLLENNTLIEQGLVLAHAGIGHGSVFKHNYLFKEWTSPESILDYFSFSKKYIAKAEQEYGEQLIEYALDACKALSFYSVSHRKNISKKIKDKTLERLKEEYNLIDNSVFNRSYKKQLEERIDNIKDRASLPEENLLYFIEKHRVGKKDTPELTEVLRIHRKIAEYFYPQRKTKILNEGWATFMELRVFDVLLEKKLITPGGYLEFLRSHTSVITQPSFKSNYYSGSLNPYSVGFKIFNDLYRMTHSPTKKDLEEYSEICNTDWKESLMRIVHNYDDDSFIRRYLTNNVSKDLELFSVELDHTKSVGVIGGTCNDCRIIRNDLANSLDVFTHIPRVEVIDVDEDNVLYLQLYCYDGMTLDESYFHDFGHHVCALWGARVNIKDHTGQRYVYD